VFHIALSVKTDNCHVEIGNVIDRYFATDVYCSLSSSRCHLSPLHLTTSKVRAIAWRLRGNIIRTVLYIANVLSLQLAQLTKTVHTARFGLEYVFLCFCRLNDLSLCLFMFHLGQLSHFPSCFGAGVTNLNEPRRVFFAPSPLLWLGAGSIP